LLCHRKKKRKKKKKKKRDAAPLLTRVPGSGRGGGKGGRARAFPAYAEPGGGEENRDVLAPSTFAHEGGGRKRNSVPSTRLPPREAQCPAPLGKRGEKEASSPRTSADGKKGWRPLLGPTWEGKKKKKATRA